MQRSRDNRHRSGWRVPAAFADLLRRMQRSTKPCMAWGLTKAETDRFRRYGEGWAARPRDGGRRGA